jgi:hypothetical protein
MYLTPSESTILRSLEKHPPGLFDRQIADILYDGREDGGGGDENIGVHVCRMRKKGIGIIGTGMLSRRRLALPDMAVSMVDVLTPSQMRLYELVKRRPGISKAEAAEALKTGDDTISVMANKMRPRMAALGETIVGKAYYGYRIEKREDGVSD